MATGYFATPITTTTSGTTAPTETGYTVSFYDIDGTLLKSELVSKGGNSTAPNANYDPNYLIFKEWNNTLTGITEDLDVGSIYETVSGYSYFQIRTVTGNTAIALNFNRPGTNLLTINWGDTTSYTAKTNGDYSISHTYTDIGDYLITLISGGALTAGLASSANCLIKPGPNIKKMYLQNNMSHSNNAFNYNCASVISLPYNWTAIQQSAFANHEISHINLPKDVSTFYLGCFIPVPYAFNRLTVNQAKPITIPNGNPFGASVIPLKGRFNFSADFLTNSSFSNMIGIDNLKMSITNGIITNTAFYRCSSLKSYEVNSNITSIGANSFQLCIAIREYILRPTTPPTITSSSFPNIHMACKIYVPDANVDNYKTATNWNLLAGYIFAISTRP